MISGASEDYTSSASEPSDHVEQGAVSSRNRDCPGKDVKLSNDKQVEGEIADWVVDDGEGWGLGRGTELRIIRKPRDYTHIGCYKWEYDSFKFPKNLLEILVNEWRND